MNIEAINFFKQTANFEAGDRMSASQALTHVWISGVGTINDV